MRTYLGLSLAAAAAGLVNVSCSQVECGLGTIERDGVCQADTGGTTPGMCGGDGPFATVLGLSGMCETEVPTVCDEETTEPSLDDVTGVTTCIGTGGGCGEEIKCGPHTGGRVSLCGRIWDTETETPLPEDMAISTNRCDPANPTTSGPCSLRLRFFDALDFAMNPQGAMPIVPPDGVYVDGCGRYRGLNMTPATFGFMGIAVDDAPGITPTTPHRLTGVATTNTFGNPGQRFHAYATRSSTDTTWTTGAGLAGSSFAERGVLAIVFTYNGMPRSGVQVRRNGSPTPSGDDFYFSDTMPTANPARSMVGPSSQTTTGANGTVLVINSNTPIAHDGIGAEPSGCVWPSNLAASIPGVVFMQIKDAETPAGAACP